MTNSKGLHTLQDAMVDNIDMGRNRQQHLKNMICDNAPSSMIIRQAALINTSNIELNELVIDYYGTLEEQSND